MENYERYMFIRDFEREGEEHPIPHGAEITIMGNKVYFNGGIVGPGYREILLDIVNNDTLRMKYLRKMVIPYNKI